MAEERREHDETGVQESNPNATGPQRLTGEMGLSSERTGPEGDAPADSGVEGTGTHGSAAHSTDGLSNTAREGEIPGPEGAHGPEMDDTQQRATQEWRDEQPAATGQEPADGGSEDPLADATRVANMREGRHAERRSADDDTGEFSSGIDRTVGESNPAEVPAHEFDRTKNPGHSHG